MFPFFSRDFINRAAIFFRVLEAQQRQRKFTENGFTLYSLPIKKWKAYKTPRILEELEYEISHISAVKGRSSEALPGLLRPFPGSWRRTRRPGRGSECVPISLLYLHDVMQRLLRCRRPTIPPPAP